MGIGLKEKKRGLFQKNFSHGCLDKMVLVSVSLAVAMFP